MMRVAVIGTVSSSLLSFRGHLIKDMVSLGHNVLAFAIDYDEDAKKRGRALGAEPIKYDLDRTGLNPLKDLKSVWQLARLLRAHKVDLVFSYFLKPAIYGTLAGVFAGVPTRYVLLPGLGYAFTDDGNRWQLYKQLVGIGIRSLLRVSLSRAEAVFLYNPDDIDEVQRRGLVRRDKIVQVNGTGVDLEAFQPAPPVKEPLTFLLAARLLREKGVREYAEAARRVKRKYPCARFFLLGGLDTNPSALERTEVEAWVSEGLLEWPGHVNDVREWLERASVFVLPSYREGVPRSTQEAMAMARPIITTDAPGCRETVVEGKNGFLVPPRDPWGLAEAMERFLADPSLIEQMGRESRKLAEERFDVRSINRRLLETMGLGRAAG